MWKVGGLKIETAASRRIILTGWHRNWWKSAFLYKTVRTRKFSTWTFLGGSTHGILTGNYSFKKLSNYKKLFKKIFIKQIWKSFIQQNYSFVWKIDYRPGLSKTPVIRFSSHFTFSSTGLILDCIPRRWLLHIWLYTSWLIPHLRGLLLFLYLFSVFCIVLSSDSPSPPSLSLSKSVAK